MGMSVPPMPGQMRVFPLDCYPDPDADPTVVMIVCAESEQQAIQIAFEHPNASQYKAVALNKSKKHKKAAGMTPGVHGFVSWPAFQALG